MIKYRKFLIIDLTIFTILAIGSEWIGSLINKDLMYLSFLPVFVLLVLVRWKWFGLISLVISSISRVFIYQAQGFSEIIIYTIPVLLLSLGLLVHKTKLIDELNKKKIIAMSYYSIFYILFVISNGLLIKMLINNSYSMLNDLPKYLISFVTGNIIYYMFVGQKVMLVDVIGEDKKKAKESEVNGKRISK